MGALAPLTGALLTVIACYALGTLLLGRLRITLTRAEKPPLAFMLGAAALHLAIFAILTVHLAYRSVFTVLLIAIIATALWTGDWRPPKRSAIKMPATWLTRAAGLVFCVTAGIFTVLYFVYAWAPEISVDGASYHIPLVAHYLQVHGFEPMTTNVYASLSEGVEMLFLAAFAVAGSTGAGASAAALVHFAFLIALALAVRAYGRRTGHAAAGSAAALLVYLSPVAGIDGTSAYVDIATAAIAFATFYWTQIWDEDRRTSLLICIGLMGGYCYAAKYTAAIMALYGAGFVLWRSRSVRGAALVGACAAIMAGPWLIKNWIYAANPIAPFANRIFRNPYVHPDFERRWTTFLRNYWMTDKRKLPWDVIVAGRSTQTPIGPIFLLAPLSLLALRKKMGRRVLLPGALLLSTYFANIGSRFLLPVLPFESLALAAVFEELPMALAILILFHGVLSWPRHLRWYGEPVWALRRWPLRAALRIQSEDNYLRGFPLYRAARFIEDNVPPGEKVFTAGNVAGTYTSRPILVNFESAFDEQLDDFLTTAWANVYQPSRALTFRFSERPLRRVRVVQTAKISDPDEQWNVHEFRFLLNGAGVPRSSDWRLRAFPNPWGIRYAFDHSEATRWRSWETAAPGMFIEVEFPGGIRADQVTIETSADDPDVRMRLEELDAAGRWVTISDSPQEAALKPDGSLRRAATYELRANGVRYIFMRDSDSGADFFSQDPASWNLTVVARSEGATIYRIGP